MTEHDRSGPAEPNGVGAWAPNQAMLKAWAEAERIQEGMRPREGKDALGFLREARSGGMYGYGDNQ